MKSLGDLFDVEDGRLIEWKADFNCKKDLSTLSRLEWLAMGGDAVLLPLSVRLRNLIVKEFSKRNEGNTTPDNGFVSTVRIGFAEIRTEVFGDELSISCEMSEKQRRRVMCAALPLYNEELVSLTRDGIVLGRGRVFPTIALLETGLLVEVGNDAFDYLFLSGRFCPVETE